MALALPAMVSLASPCAKSTLCLDCGHSSVDAGSPNAQPLGNLTGPQALSSQSSHVPRIDGGLAPLVRPGLLSLGDTHQLPLLPQARLELREYPKHLEESSARWR